MQINLILFIDNNGLQIDGTIEEVKNMDNLKEKFQSFGFNVQEINGHDFNQIINSVKIAKESNKPNCILAKTITGKGVSFMENQVKWHGKSLTEEEYLQAMKELS